MKTKWTYVLIILIVIVGGYWFLKRMAPQKPLEVVILITSDAQRRDHMGCYGYKRPTTPYLSSHLDQWIRFNNHYSVASYSGPSYASIVSGQWPVNNGTMHWESIKHAQLMDVVEEAGFRTYFVGSNRPPYLKDHFINRFDEVFHLPAKKIERENLREYDEMIREMVRIIKHKKGDEKIFIYGFFFHVHWPYGHKNDPENFRKVPFMELPAEYSVFDDFLSGKIIRNQVLSDNGKKVLNWRFGFPDYYSQEDFEYTIAIYDKQILSMDSYLRRIMEEIHREELEDRSLVFFTADHGESLGEDGQYFWHGFSIHESNIHVPLLVFNRGRGGEKSMITRHIDIVPSIAFQLNVKPENVDGRNIFSPGGGNIVAVSMSNFFRARNPRDFSQSRLDYMGEKGRMYALRWKQWKLVRRTRKDGTFYFSLYHISSDPHERINLSGDYPEVLNKMKKHLKSYYQINRVKGMSREQEEYLKSLGYL